MINNKKRFVLFLGLFLFSVAVVSAVWVFNLTGSATYSFTNSDPNSNYKIYMNNLVGASGIDTTNGAVILEEALSLDNQGAERNLIMDLEITRTDIEDSCLDYLDDVVVKLMNKDKTITYNSGGAILIKAGYNNFKVVLDAVQSSCPQEVDVVISFHL